MDFCWENHRHITLNGTLDYTSNDSQVLSYYERRSSPIHPILAFINPFKYKNMAKYSKGASDKVEKAMHEMKRGKLKSGRSGKTVKSRKQAIAIGLSEARERGAKVPPPKKKSAAKKGTKRATKKSAPKKGTKRATKKSASKRAPARKTASKRGGRKSASKKR
jgi:hypothetical protein